MDATEDEAMRRFKRSRADALDRGPRRLRSRRRRGAAPPAHRRTNSRRTSRRAGAWNHPSGVVRYGLRFVALAYLGLLLIVPVGIIVAHTFSGGLEPVWSAITAPDAVKALVLTLEIALIAVPLNTVFGITMAILLVRRDFPGKTLLSALIDLPFAVSPVIVGFTLILVYGQNGWFGSFFINQGHQVIFATPGMVLATIFASLPFVAREVVPVLREIGTEQEQAASTLGARPFQTFRRITLPAIRWGIVYGVVLTTARSIGEFGAVAVVSGNVIGQTQTLTLRVSQEYQNFNHTAAYTAALELAVIALVTLFLMNLFHPRKDRDGNHGA